MPLFRKDVFNTDKARHERIYVNQQDDGVMGIFWDTSAYRFDVSDEEARRIAASWGWSSFDPAQEIDDARRDLAALDDARMAGR